MDAQRVTNILVAHHLARHKLPFETQRRIITLYAMMPNRFPSAASGWLKAFEDPWTTWMDNNQLHKYAFEKGMAG